MNQSKAMSAMLVLMLLFAGQAAADFPQCFGPCILGCVLTPDLFPCAAKCLVKCIIPAAPVSSKAYCKLGCAIDQCAGLGDDVNKVADCVNSCETGKCSDIPSPN